MPYHSQIVLVSIDIGQHLLLIRFLSLPQLKIKQGRTLMTGLLAELLQSKINASKLNFSQNAYRQLNIDNVVKKTCKELNTKREQIKQSNRPNIVNK